MALHLIIGNKNYSSWSFRPWIALKVAGIPFTEEVISGFTGRIRYACDHGTEAEAADFGALLAFAAYAGAGSHTTYGFGVLRPEPTWQPPTLRPAQP